MRVVLTGALIALLAIPATRATAEEEAWNPKTHPLPTGWSEIRVIEHTPEVVKSLFARVGGPFETLTERHLSANGFPLKLNILTTKTEEQAKTIHLAMAKARGGLFFRRKGTILVEAANVPPLGARRMWAWLGLTLEPESRWSFEAPVGLVAAHDYMEANLVFNHFLQIEKYPEHGTAPGAIKALCADWKTGTTIDLLTHKRPWFEASYALAPEGKAGTAGALTTRFTVAKPKTRLGLHYAELKATVRATARWTPAKVEGDPGSTASTPFWPVDDADMQSLAKRLTKDAKTDRERILAIQRYVGIDLRYSGTTGSRWGTKKVVGQGFGQCWDKSDVLVTLARAVGIPARQIAGWVPIINSGHVWAEVRLRDEGWIPVDPTTPWLGISQDYIPLYATDDGAMPIVYLGWPKITTLPAKPR